MLNGDCVPDVGLARICLRWSEFLVSFAACTPGDIESLLKFGNVEICCKEGKKVGNGRIPLPMRATPIAILEIDVAVGDTEPLLCKTVWKTNPWSRGCRAKWHKPELKSGREVNGYQLLSIQDYMLRYV